MIDFDTRVETMRPAEAPPLSPTQQRALQLQRAAEDQQAARLRARSEILDQLEAIDSGGEKREEVDGLWAWCGNVIECSDAQVQTRGLKITTARTYRDGGDTGPNADRVETSAVHYDFLTDDERYCEKCGGGRHISDQKRVVYPPLSGKPPSGLVDLARAGLLKQLSMEPGQTFQEAKAPAAATPLDRLGVRLADGEITVEEYLERRAAIEGVPPVTQAIEDAFSAADNKLPKGVRAHGAGFQAYKRVDGKQVQKSFETVEEATAWREEAS